MEENFLGTIDWAAVAIWGFWLFFAGLVIYIQRENMREGYPLEDDDGESAANQGPYPVPGDKTFILRGGHGTLTVPSGQKAERPEIKDIMQRTSGSQGFPFEPTGNPMTQGVGPASWQNRADRPEPDAHGHPKIVPISSRDDHMISAGIDPTGMPVVSGDRYKVGTVVDMWADVPEALIRYLEVELDSGAGKRLIPMNMAILKRDRVNVRSLYAEHFDDVPTTKSATQITMLEEEKIMAYYAGGTLYAGQSRSQPAV